MDVCVRLFCVCVALCVGNGRVTSWSPSKESYRLYIIQETEKAAKVQQRAVEPQTHGEKNIQTDRQIDRPNYV
jgi:hypothetical protein